MPTARVASAISLWLAVLLWLALGTPVEAQETPARVRLSGYIRNSASREVVRYALVAADNEPARSQSSEDGFYFLMLERGQHRIRVRALGYAPFDTLITLDASRVLDLSLKPATVELASVAVQADREVAQVDPKAPEMSVARLDLKVIRQAPSVLGEIDPIRSLTLLPGVSRSSDASTAFSVRGGSADQNLILLDESTIYNPAHILGFLSVFNSDAIDDVTPSRPRIT